MAVANLVRVFSVTTGTGTLTLGAAVTGFLTSANSGMQDGAIYSYAIEADYVIVGDDSVPMSRECGTGVYTASGTTLTRSVVNSTNGNALLNLAGDEQVIITPLKADDFDIGDPTGRLTLVTGQPVMNSNQTAKTTIFYCPFPGAAGLSANATHGPYLPSFNGTDTWMIDCGGEQSFILDATNHVNAGIYDFFWDDAGNRLVTGPAWTNTTTRSAALAYKNGFLTNSGSMTGRISNNGGTTTIGANRGFYLGTIRCTAAGQTGMAFTSSGATGGAGVLGLYNAYNRVPIIATEWDTTASWTVASATFRAAHNSANNSISFIDGLGDTSIAAAYQVLNATTVSGEGAQIGINLNATTGTPSVISSGPFFSGTFSSITATINCNTNFLPTLGYNTITAMEAATSGVTVTVSGGQANQGLTIAVSM